MSIQEMLRHRIAAAPHRSIEWETLKLLLSDVQQAEQSKDRGGNKPLTEGEFLKIVRQSLHRNHETMSFLAESDERFERLKIENAHLRDFIPTYLSQTEIETCLEPIADELRAFDKSGLATGRAVAFFKERKLDVEGGTVKAAVEQIRSAVTTN